MSIPAATTLDVRTLAPHERHATIFHGFDTLPAGHALLLINDHDPLPLRYQLQTRSGGQFDWAYLEAGPDLWRVQITKRAAAPDSCCSGGACCG